MNGIQDQIAVAALYRFARFAAPSSLVAPLEQACRAEGVKGTLLVAPEGINGTIAGAPEGLARALAEIGRITGLHDIDVKLSRHDAMPFLRMKVKLKREIVTMGEPSVDPLKAVGTYVEPADWNALVDDPDVLLIDVRNAFEHRIGTFEGAIDPETTSFGDFPAFVRSRLAGEKGRKVAMFCTGGIRCEKASAFMLQEGFSEVHHLKGGILRYLEQVPEAQSRWQGGCFVFDERIAVGHGMAADARFTLCHGCRQPLTAEDIADPDHEEGVSCRHCAGSLTLAQRAAARERHRQMQRAKALGVPHIGPDAQRAGREE